MDREQKSYYFLTIINLLIGEYVEEVETTFIDFGVTLSKYYKYLSSKGYEVELKFLTSKKENIKKISSILNSFKQKFGLEIEIHTNKRDGFSHILIVVIPEEKFTKFDRYVKLKYFF